MSRGRARGWLATILLAAAPASAQAPGVRVVYLANEGVILEGAGGRVLIDALFGDGLPDYAVVARPSRDSLERGLAHYGGPVVLLATHAHRDHYDSAAVARYLRSNPEAAAVGVPGAAPHKVGPIELGWVKARPVVIPHGPTRRPVVHTGWIVTLDGTTALHIGDASSDPKSWAPLGLPARGADLALVPYWYALDDELFRSLLEVVQPSTVVLLHVPVESESGYLAQRGGWQTVSRKLRERDPRIRTPSSLGEVVLPRSSSEAPASPGPRNAYGAAYDLRGRSLVLFGGATDRDVRGDTWRWKAGGWRRLPGPGPEPRTFPAMAYDSARGAVVLFGGNRVLFGDSTSPARMLGDTWVLRDDRWTRASAAGPSPRAEAAMAYDARRGRTVLFGGRDLRPDGGTSRLADTWEWDGRRWRRVGTAGPPARSGAAMAYDPAFGVVLFGGSGGPRGDTWRWDGRAWARVPVPDAPGRFNAAMAWDARSRRLVRFGGWDGKVRVADTWALGDSGWALIDTGGPRARNHAVLVGATDRGSLLLYGGHDGDRVFGDLWERRDGRWVALDSAVPVARAANGH